LSNNLFIDLFKYRPSEANDPLENFATEILKNACKHNEPLLQHFYKIAGFKDGIKNVDIESQKSLGRLGFADLYIRYNDAEAIIIENKINAGFQERQINKYREFLSHDCKRGQVIALIQFSADFNEIDPGIPDEVLYWYNLAQEIKDIIAADGEGKYLAEFYAFLKENNMALEKVGSSLTQGLRDKQNLLNIVKSVLNDLTTKKMIARKPNAKDSHSEDYNSFNYFYHDKYDVAISFFHSKSMLYVSVYDPEKKISAPRNPWGQHAFMAEFDLNKGNFYSAGLSDQVDIIRDFINATLKKIPA